MRRLLPLVVFLPLLASCHVKRVRTSSHSGSAATVDMPVTRVIRLEHATVQAVERAMRPTLPRGARLLVEPRTNTVILEASESQLADLLRRVEDLDTKQ